MATVSADLSEIYSHNMNYCEESKVELYQILQSV